jgi:hypothetical protein
LPFCILLCALLGAYCKLMFIFVLLLQAWVFSHFPSLFKNLPPVQLTYPAVRAWATCDRTEFRWSYDEVRVALNSMTMDKVSVCFLCTRLCMLYVVCCCALICLLFFFVSFNHDLG